MWVVRAGVASGGGAVAGVVGGSCGGVGAVGAGGGSGWGCLMSWWVGVGGRSCVIGASGRGKYGRWDVGSVRCGVYHRRNLRFLVVSLPEPSVRTED